jgi:hypothetical protein
MAVAIEFAGRDAGAQRIDGAVRLGAPAFGQAEGEDEDVERLEQSAHRREMPAPIQLVFALCREAAGLDGRAERVEHGALLARPGIVARRELAIGAAEQLQQLPRGVDRAVARAEQPVAECLGRRRRQRRMGRLRLEVAQAGGTQAADQMLREAAAGRGDRIGRCDAPGCGDHRVDRVRRRLYHCLAPAPVRGGIGIGVGHAACLRSSSTSAP